jgi:hypothetical protein
MSFKECNLKKLIRFLDFKTILYRRKHYHYKMTSSELCNLDNFLSYSYNFENIWNSNSYCLILYTVKYFFEYVWDIWYVIW